MAPSTAAVVLASALWMVTAPALWSATTIAAYDALPDPKAKSTLLAGIIVAVSRALVTDLRSPRDASNQLKTTEKLAQDRQRAVLVPQAVAGKLVSSDRIGLLAVRIALARKQDPAMQLETVVKTWILDQIAAFEAAPATRTIPR